MNKEKINIVAFGEILWDIIGHNKYLGGAPLNFVAHAKQCKSQVSIVSSLGNDELGRKALQAIESKGINTDLIEVHPSKNTGTVNVFLDNGQPDYEISKNVAYDEIRKTKLDSSKVDAFYFGTLVQRNTTSRTSLRSILEENQFEFVFYDVNLRKECFSKEIISYSLGKCNILKLNKEEVETINELVFDQEGGKTFFLRSIEENYPNIEIVIITAGGEGCYVCQQGSMTKIVSNTIEVVDAIGAGDAFSAAFLTTYLRSNDVMLAGKIANKVGGYVASHSGAMPIFDVKLLDWIETQSNQSKT